MTAPRASFLDPEEYPPRNGSPMLVRTCFGTCRWATSFNPKTDVAWMPAPDTPQALKDKAAAMLMAGCWI